MAIFGVNLTDFGVKTRVLGLFGPILGVKPGVFGVFWTVLGPKRSFWGVLSPVLGVLRALFRPFWGVNSYLETPPVRREKILGLITSYWSSLSLLEVMFPAQRL